MPKIFDNIESQLATALNTTLEVSHRADFCVGYFNLRGWKGVADHIDGWAGEKDNRCRLLVGMQKLPQDLIRDFFSLSADDIVDMKRAKEIKRRLAEEFKEQLTFGIPTDEDERGLRKLSKQIKEKKVVVKLFLRHTLHAKLYLLFREDKITPVIGYLGSSNLTLAGLSKQGELNVDVLEQDAANKLVKWFEDRWDDRWCIDISDDLIDVLDTSWAADRLVHPYHIYLKIAYHLSREARAGITEFRIPKIFQNELLEFQQKAVLVAAHHLNKRDGVIIGDVVGLGKTMTASALAKIFEDDFFLETLIICPKNLTDMWEDYRDKYRLHARVLPITMVQNKLPDLRRYRLVVIDESHNLRNRDGKRYRAIQEYIQLNDSKVIMLSATPYNKSYLDLSNQLRLFIPEDRDLGISPEQYIEQIGGRVQFIAQHQVSIRSIAAFEKSVLPDDWRELMRLYLVRRTRSFIKDNYAETDPVNGRKFLRFSDGQPFYFPERTPKKVEYTFDPNDPKDQYAQLYSLTNVEILNGLNLPRYGLGNYINQQSSLMPTPKEKTIIENLSRAGKRLMGFSRTNLFKRLESSGYSFLISVARHILRNYIFIYAIESDLPLPIGAQETSALEVFLDDEDPDSNDTEFGFRLVEDKYFTKAQEIYNTYEKKYANRFDWIRSGLFKKILSSELLSDSKELLKVLEIGKDWNTKEDRQLNALYELCNQKHKSEKILIFTQYADTANYLTDEFKKRGLKHIECVTGKTENPTSSAYRFSPVSNDKKGIVGTDKELRIIITTDVLSEGQNLQDAHIIVNYDLPWAIIRLIQRAGRVDRIGQKADEVLCYSFLPEDGIEQIIKLRGRLTRRIKENAEVVGSDETFFEGDPVNIQDLYNEKSGILDDDEDNEIDLASFAFQIWKNATDENPKLKKIVPDLANVIYATKKTNDLADFQQGVIVYSRTSDDNDVLAWVDEHGNLITQSQFTILKAARCTQETKPEYKIENHHNLVGEAINYIKEIESKIGGQLGKKSSARYRTYMRLTRYYEEYEYTLFVNEQLKRTIDDIYKYPLKEYARETLNRQLKAGINDEDLATLVVTLRDEEKLSSISDEVEKHKEPQIICSLGLSREDK